MKENTEKDQTLTELFGAKNLMGHGPRLSSDDSFITCRIVQDIFCSFSHIAQNPQEYAQLQAGSYVTTHLIAPHCLRDKRRFAFDLFSPIAALLRRILQTDVRCISVHARARVCMSAPACASESVQVNFHSYVMREGLRRVWREKGAKPGCRDSTCPGSTL